jgi:hypothetical protein
MDLISILTWLAGAGVAAVSSFVLDRLQGFAQLSASGKQLVAVAVAVILGALSMAARDWLSANPTAAQGIEPYAQLIVTGVMLIVQQVTHGARRAAAEAGNG